MLKQSLQQKMLQKLSPLQIQVIKLLEIPTAQLEQRIKEELEQNPVLEYGSETQDYDDDYGEEADTPESDIEKDELSIEDYIHDDEIPAYKLQAKNYSKDDKHDDIPFSSASTFHEQLVSQLGLQVMTDRQLAIAEYIIGNIDEDGYLRREIDEIVDDIAFSQNLEVDEKEALEVLRVIQDFDPAGVGARDLRECLILQMDRKKGETVASDNALEILKDYFEEFTRKHYEKIAKRMQLDDDDLKDAIDEILKLNPKPGGSLSSPMSRTA